MIDRQNLERISQTYGKLSELFHKMADSNSDAERDRLKVQIDRRQQELLGLGEPITGEVHVAPAPVEPATSATVPAVPIVPGAPTPVAAQPEPAPATAPPLKISRPHWLGDWSGDVARTVSELVAAGPVDEVLLIVAYNIPNRDGGGYSSNVGKPNAPKDLGEWLSWVQSIARAIPKGRDLMVVLEPDALGQLDRLTEDARGARLVAMKMARNLLESAGATVYVDASTWVDPTEMRRRLDAVGAKRFSCNVSGFDDTKSVMAWADQVGLPYAIDTSRNGNGQPHPGKWCNPTDVRIGVDPTHDTGNPNCELFLHAKVAGESDGKGINDDGSHPRDDVPDAGEWWQDYFEAISTGSWESFKAKYHV